MFPLDPFRRFLPAAASAHIQKSGTLKHLLSVADFSEWMWADADVRTVNLVFPSVCCWSQVSVGVDSKFIFKYQPLVPVRSDCKYSQNQREQTDHVNHVTVKHHRKIWASNDEEDRCYCLLINSPLTAQYYIVYHVNLQQWLKGRIYILWLNFTKNVKFQIILGRNIKKIRFVHDY